MKEIKFYLALVSVLILFQFSFGQKNNEEIKSINKDSYAIKYKNYHKLIKELNDSENDSLIEILSDSIINQTLKLTKEENVIFFTNALTDTVLRKEIKICLLLLTSGDDNSNFIFMKEQIENNSFQEFEKFIDINSKLSEKENNCDFEVNIMNEKELSLKVFVRIKYHFLKFCEYEMYKLNYRDLKNYFKNS